MFVHILFDEILFADGFDSCIIGIPDILIFEPRQGYCGLALEVKTNTGRASEHQKEWQKKLRERGWKAEICKGLEACIDCIDEYFEDSSKVL